MSEQVKEVPLELELIKGLGDVSIPKLNALGIFNIVDLAVAASADIAVALGKSQDFAVDLVIRAHDYVIQNNVFKKELMTTRERLELERTRKQLVTGVKDFDLMLGGGIQTRAITEFYGEYGSGKSQICFTLSVLATLPEEQGGLNGNTLYIDVEGTYSATRINQIIEARKLDSNILDKIYCERPESSALLEFMVKQLPKLIVDNNIKLVVIDSIIVLHRQEFVGRENLARRQQHLGVMMNKLLKVAESYNLAVVISNQIAANPAANPMYGQETEHAAGGNVIAHASSHRIKLHKLSGRIKAKVIDSPNLSNSECLFTVNEKGIDNYNKKV